MNMIDLFEISLESNLSFLKLPKEKLKLAFYFFACIPLAIILRAIQKPILRTVYNLIFGIFFLLFFGKNWFLFVNFLTILIFAIGKIIPQKSFIPITIVSFLALCYVHYLRYISEDSNWRIDFNVIQMILTCRYIYFASELEDGKLDKYKFSLLEYYSYIFLYSNLIVGTLPFSDFLDFIRLTGHYQKMQFNLKPMIITFVKTLLFMAGDMILRPRFDFNWFDSQAWLEMNLLEKQLLTGVIAFCARLRYFMAFKFAQTAMDGMGISYNGKNEKGEELYDRYLTADYRYEIEYNTIIKTSYWNQTVQFWLKNCFYDRFAKKSQNLALYLTFIVSAQWHGFFLIYYFFFIEWAVFNQVSKYFYRARDKFKFIPTWVKVVIAWTYCHVIVNQTAIPVGLLDWNRGVRFSNDVYWFGQIVVLSLFLFFFLTQFGQKSEKKKIK